MNKVPKILATAAAIVEGVLTIINIMNDDDRTP